MYLGLNDRESLPTLGNNTGVWIMNLGLYDREPLPTLGTTQVSGYSIWDNMTGNHSLLWEQHRFMDTVFGIICQGITPYSRNNTGFWIQYLGQYDSKSLPTLGNNTGVCIMYLGLYMSWNHSLLWEQHRYMNHVFATI